MCITQYGKQKHIHFKKTFFNIDVINMRIENA